MTKLTVRNTPALAYVKTKYNAKIYKAFSQDANQNGLLSAIDWFVGTYVAKDYRDQIRTTLTSPHLLSPAIAAPSVSTPESATVEVVAAVQWPSAYGYKIGDGVQLKGLNVNAQIVEFRTPRGIALASEIINLVPDLYVCVSHHGDLLGWDFKDLADFPRSYQPSVSAPESNEPTRPALTEVERELLSYLAESRIEDQLVQHFQSTSYQAMYSLERKGFTRVIGKYWVITQNAGRAALESALGEDNHA